VALRKLIGSDTWRDLLADSGTVLVLKVVGTGVGYLLHLVIARWMGADIYGGYVFAMSWALLLAKAGDLGLSSAAVRLVPEYTTTGQWSRLRGFLTSSRRLVLLASVAAAGLAAGTAWLWTPPSLSYSGLLAGIALAPLLAHVDLETSILRARDRMVAAYAPSNVLRPLLALAGMAGLVALLPSPSATAVLGVAGIALAATFLVQRWANHRSASASLRRSEADRHVRSWLSLSIPLLFSSGFLLVFSKTDVFLLGFFLPAEQVGIYGAALKTAQVVTLTGFAVDAVAGPAVARTYADRDREALQVLARRLVILYFGTAVVVAAGIVVASPWVLSLFGPEFLAGQPAFFILVGGLLVNASTGAQSFFLTMTGRERPCMWIHAGCAVLNIALNAVGITLYGIVGAAAATAISLAVLNVWIHRTVVRELHVTPSILAFLPRRSHPTS
jgi:O-antigen/teichoic acid export membrane protein